MLRSFLNPELTEEKERGKRNQGRKEENKKRK